MSSKTPNQDVPNTLYPKITGNLKTYLLNSFQHVSSRNAELKQSDNIALTGTVKLHGMHADVVFDRDDSIRIQSRNLRQINLNNDLHGLAAYMLPLEPELLVLKQRIEQRFSELNPGMKLNRDYPLIIAGEWIGPGVQKKVAISQLPHKLFVIISININNEWVPDEPYGDIHDEGHRIYHISRGGFYHHDLPLGSVITSLEALQPLADAAEKECPFARTFGISGPGEGIVWKPAPPLCSDPRYWIKMKGPISKGIPLPQKTYNKNEVKEEVRDFAHAVVGEMRLEQGWQYMMEMGMQRDEAGLSTTLLG